MRGLATLKGIPLHLPICTFIQLANHVATSQCLRTWRNKAKALSNEKGEISD